MKQDDEIASQADDKQTHNDMWIIFGIRWRKQLRTGNTTLKKMKGSKRRTDDLKKSSKILLNANSKMPKIIPSKKERAAAQPEQLIDDDKQCCPGLIAHPINGESKSVDPIIIFWAYLMETENDAGLGASFSADALDNEKQAEESVEKTTVAEVIGKGQTISDMRICPQEPGETCHIARNWITRKARNQYEKRRDI